MASLMSKQSARAQARASQGERYAAPAPMPTLRTYSIHNARQHQAVRAAEVSCKALSGPQGSRDVATRATLAAPRPTITEVETPAKLGFTMPGEFEPHEACWMGWPDSARKFGLCALLPPCIAADPYDAKCTFWYLWREDAKPAQACYARVAKAISQFEPLIMFANPGQAAADAREAFKDAPNVTVVEQPINDGWTRDWGPSCIVKDDPETGKRMVAGVHWDYDCYGGIGKKKLGRPVMMPDWSRDYAAGRALLERHGLRVFEAPLHLEGGSIHSDGQGTLVVTEQCLLDPSRNPNLDREGIEAVLKEYLGLDKIIWLWKGMAGDDAITNGHVDNFATFSEPGTILMSWCKDPFDPQYEICHRNLEILENTTDARGRKLKVVKVPCPPPLFRTYHEADGVAPDHVEKGYCPRIAGERLPASYINHYIANGGVVVPQFGGAAVETDKEALEVLAAAYPGRKVVGVSSREAVLNAGNVHCITQQLVAARD